jgi:cobalamin-dependent methionine synthase I
MDYKVYIERRIVTEVIREVHRTGDRLADSAQSRLHHEIRKRVAVKVGDEPEDVEALLHAVRSDLGFPPASPSPRIRRRSFLRRLLDALPSFWPFTE